MTRSHHRDDGGVESPVYAAYGMMDLDGSFEGADPKTVGGPGLPVCVLAACVNAGST